MSAPTTVVPAVLHTPDAAAYLGLAPKTLENWRVAKTGPRYARLGRVGRPRIVYRITDLDAWLAAQVVETDAGSSAGGDAA